MAFLGFKYIRRGKNASATAKATLGYNGTRPGKDHEKLTRTLFGHDGPLTEAQVEEMIANAPKNTYFWRMILSPDPNGENKDRNLDLWRLTKDIVEFLEERLKRDIPFIAAEHNDHTKIPHIHAIVLIQRRGKEMLITKETLKELRDLAASSALSQKRERDRFEESKGERKAQVPTLRKDYVPVKRGRMRLATIGQTCPQCGPGQPMKRFGQDGYWCPTCGYTLERSLGPGLESEGVACNR